MKFNPGVTLVILAILTLVGAGYMSLGVLDIGPTKQFTRLTLMLDTSGGLLPTSQVTMRGIKVGRVTGIHTTQSGLAVSIDVDSAYLVPADSEVSVQNLSVAGEQYIDFAPAIIEPPYFTDGMVIPADRVEPVVTVSDLLARANALLSVVDPAAVNTIVTNISQAMAGNDDILDSLATTSDLFAQMVEENKQLLATLFGNISTLTTGMDDLKVGAVISETGTLLPDAVPAFLRLIRQFDGLSGAGESIFGPGDPAGELVAKLSEYIDMLAGPLSTFATVLEPATAPLRDVKVDAGHWLDFWESTFNDSGGLRVQVNVPELHQP